MLRQSVPLQVHSLKGKLEKDMQLHRTDNLRIMQENVALIKEINELRREIKMLKAAAQRASSSSNSSTASKEMETQRKFIQDLQLQVRNHSRKLQANYFRNMAVVIAPGITHRYRNSEFCLLYSSKHTQIQI